MESSSIFFTKFLRNGWLFVPLWLLVGVLILLFAYFQYNWPGKLTSVAQTLSWSGEALTLGKGRGHVEQNKLVIEELKKQDVAVVMLPTLALRAEDYVYVNWTVTNVPPDVELELLWRTADNRAFMRPALLTSGSVASLRVTEDENWRGQIVSLALVVKGPLAAPIAISGVTLEPASYQGVLLHKIKRWLEFEPWQGTSINFVGGNATEQSTPPVWVVAMIILLALIPYLILVKIKIQPMNIAVVWGVVFLGWFVLDARWQLNLFRQTYLTYQQLAGKSWEDKHLAADDGPLFNFMQQIKAKLQPTQSRVFLFADDEYTYRRGAYHLLPLNVFSRRDLLAAGQFKSGDFIVIIGKDEVEYDPPSHLLKWGSQQQLKADLLLLAANNVLLRVQ